MSESTLEFPSGFDSNSQQSQYQYHSESQSQSESESISEFEINTPIGTRTNQKKEEEKIFSESKYHFDKGVKYEQEGEYDEAIKRFLYSLKLRKSIASTHFHLANIYEKKYLLEKALFHFQKAAILKPNISKYNECFVHCQTQLEEQRKLYYNIHFDEYKNYNKIENNFYFLQQEEIKRERDEKESIKQHNKQYINALNLIDKYAPNHSIKKDNLFNHKIKFIQIKMRLERAMKQFDTNDKEWKLLNKEMDKLINKQRIKLSKYENNKNESLNKRCKYCYGPNFIKCEHLEKRKKGSNKKIHYHKYKYYFETSD